MSLREDHPDRTPRAERTGMPVRLQDRAARLQANGGFTDGPLDDLEKSGRVQLATLIEHGLYPGWKVLDVGCGSLRAGYCR